MTLIKVLPKGTDTVLKIYKSKSGKITNLLKTPYGAKVAYCDKLGNPQKLVDIAASRKDVYIKAADGSTILKKKDVKLNISQLLFNNLSEIMFGI